MVLQRYYTTIAEMLHWLCKGIPLFLFKDNIKQTHRFRPLLSKNKNITLQKERQRTGGSRNNGTTELWNHGTTDLRNKGISTFLYPLDFCPLSFVVSLRSDSEAFSTFLHLLGNEAKYLSNF